MKLLLRFLLWFSRWRGWPPRVIPDRNSPETYLTRYFLIGGPRTEGMEDDNQDRAVGLFLHRFHRSDAAGELHSHPWAWAVSLILAGGYSEERFDHATGLVVRRAFYTGNVNFIRSTDFHRVDLDNGECWTLFLVGPKVGSWGFLDRFTRKFTPWKQYLGQ